MFPPPDTFTAAAFTTGSSRYPTGPCLTPCTPHTHSQARFPREFNPGFFIAGSQTQSGFIEVILPWCGNRIAAWAGASIERPWTKETLGFCTLTVRVWGLAAESSAPVPPGVHPLVVQRVSTSSCLLPQAATTHSSTCSWHCTSHCIPQQCGN